MGTKKKTSRLGELVMEIAEIVERRRARIELDWCEFRVHVSSSGSVEVVVYDDVGETCGSLKQAEEALFSGSAPNKLKLR